MKLLVAGHPLIGAYYQRKYLALKRLDPSLQLRIVGPQQMAHPFGMRYCEVHRDLEACEVHGLAAALSFSHMTYLLDPAALSKILRSFQPDVIHVEEEPQAFLTQEILALRAVFCRRAALTVFTWDNLLRRRRFPLGQVKRLLRDAAFRRVSAIACGNQEAEGLLRERDGFAGRTEVMPQFGLDPREHMPDTETNLKRRLGLAEGIVVGYAGRLVPEKGVELLLRALASLAALPWKLLLVGAGPLEDDIHRRWMPRLPGRIVHAPAIAQSDVPSYMRCMDIFVLASYATPMWKEQFGLALAQAMLLGIPSIASDSGAIPEIAGPGALLFEEQNEEGLREALQLLLGSSDRRRELGARARLFALQLYTEETVAARYLAFFRQAQKERAVAVRQVGRPASVGLSVAVGRATSESSGDERT